MIDLSVKARAFLLAFVPMLLITTILSIYFLRAQLDDIETSINERGTSMAIHLANASEYGLFSGNTENLNRLLQHSAEEEGILSISIIDNSGNLFVRTQENSSENSNHLHNDKRTRLFRHPIILHTTNINSIDEFGSLPDSINENEILGWIEITISTHQIEERRNQFIWNAIFIILTGLIASILLSLWMGKSLTDPIIHLTQAVHRVENGNLDEVIKTSSSGEIGTLEKGFMSMLGKIRVSQKDLQDKVDKTTLGLKNSLSIVEKQNQELIEARTKALEASKTKSRFLANISHEIRTPMNGILGFVRLLKKSHLNKEQYDYLDTIERSSDNLLHLIEDILDISRIEEGKLAIKSKSFNLRDCIEEVTVLMAPTVMQKGLDITYFYYSDVPYCISAPYERIRQVLINLIGNAVKFSEQGTIVIRVMLDPDSSNSLKISITDQGVGIPDDEKDHVFTPFTQLDDTSTRLQGGTGLGLAISKSITRAMGGNVGLEDNPNGGSIFWFTFPYQDANTTDSFIRNDQPLSSVPVLLYDRNPHTLSSIHADATEAGFSVSDYSNPDDLRSALDDSHTTSICILSLSQEEIGSNSTKIFVEGIAEYPNISLFLLISSIESSDTQNARDCGADICLTKPYRYQEMVKCLKQLSDPGNTSTPDMIPSQQDKPPVNLFEDVNILLAEDNAINTKLIQTVLGETGAKITHANNGEEAVNNYNAKNFDIILMDIQMPKMNGIDATDIIRNSGNRGSQIPIIGMTANALPDDITEYKKTGFSDILIKPIAIDDLLYEIQNWLRQSQADNDSAYNTLKPVRANSENDSHNNTQLGISNQLSNDLYGMLLDELPQVLLQLQESYSEQDWITLRKQAHKLLGGISYCNVPELKQRILDLQSSLKNNKDSISSDFEALISEIKKLI